MPKKKKKENVLAIMLGEEGDKSEYEEDDIEDEYEEDEGEYGEAFQESAAAMMGSIDAGDSEAFASALKDAILTCLEESGIE